MMTPGQRDRQHGSPGPRSDGPTLVSLAAVTWRFPLVGRTRMLSEAWAEMGVRNIFVQSASVRNMAERLTGREDVDGIVVRPLAGWPGQFARVLSRRAQAAWARVAAGELREQLDPLIAWEKAVALVTTPAWTPWLERLPFAGVIYDCIDDVAIHAKNAAHLDVLLEWERSLLGRCDAVTASADLLLERARRLRRELGLPPATERVIRNGVNLARFDADRTFATPADMPRTGRPVVGFVGALAEWIDWGLIESVARLLPESDFVFVGPWVRSAPIERLSRLTNVVFLGPRPYEQVPAYMASFDVAWVPFDRSAISAAANPVKIYEYLALGLSVVTTPVADVELLRSVCRLGADDESVARELRLALRDGASGREQRIAFARSNSWASRAQEMAGVAASLTQGDEARQH